MIKKFIMILFLSAALNAYAERYEMCLRLFKDGNCCRMQTIQFDDEKMPDGREICMALDGESARIYCELCDVDNDTKTCHFRMQAQPDTKMGRECALCDLECCFDCDDEELACCRIECPYTAYELCISCTKMRENRCCCK